MQSIFFLRLWWEVSTNNIEKITEDQIISLTGTTVFWNKGKVII